MVQDCRHISNYFNLKYRRIQIEEPCRIFQPVGQLIRLSKKYYLYFTEKDIELLLVPAKNSNIGLFNGSVQCVAIYVFI